jgi:hypothetical protein
VYWPVLAALGDALTAILGCAGILAGVWFMARGSRAGAGLSIASSAPPPPPAPVADPAEPPDPPATTTFRHGAIRLVGEPAAEGPPAPGLAAVPAPEPEPELAPEPEPELAPEPEPEPEPYVPPPVPRAPRTSFRQGPIRLGGIEHGARSRGPGDEPPDAA